MRPVFCFLFIVFLYSCQAGLPKVQVFKVDNFVLVDTAAAATQFLSTNNLNSDYPIYYKGLQRDTIRIGHRYWTGRTTWKNTVTPWSRSYSSKTIKIFVDTSLKINAPVEYISVGDKVNKDSTINYHAFLFSIKNISDSTVYIGKTFSVFFLYREAKNKQGNWVQIEKSLSEAGLCLTGEPTIVLNPGELILSKLKRLKGTQTTDFRLCFGYGNNIAYSNVFREAIDERTINSISSEK